MKCAKCHEEDGRLTPRQEVIARMIAAGKAKGDVASELDISKNTVDCHMAAIYRKLGVTNRVQFTHEAIRRGLVKVRQEGEAA